MKYKTKLLIIKTGKILIATIVLISILFILFICIPLLINWIYLPDTFIRNSKIVTSFNKQDVLNFYGDILTFIGTTSLGIIALIQNYFFRLDSNKKEEKQERRERLKELPEYGLFYTKLKAEQDIYDCSLKIKFAKNIEAYGCSLGFDAIDCGELLNGNYKIEKDEIIITMKLKTNDSVAESPRNKVNLNIFFKNITHSSVFYKITIYLDKYLQNMVYDECEIFYGAGKPIIASIKK